MADLRSGDQKKTERMVSVTVARGRTLVTSGANHAVDVKHHGPGAQIEMSEAEAKRFREAGYLVDPGTTTTFDETNSVTPEGNGRLSV